MSRTSRFDGSVIGQWLVGLALVLLSWWLLRLQTRPWPAVTPLLEPRVIAGVALAAYAAFCGWIAWRGRMPRIVANTDGQAPWRVIHASQTGFALELAERTAQALRDAGQAASVHDINAIDLHALHDAHCLFIASTTGEGDPPDHAMGFVKRVMAQPADLPRTRYAVLALGDSEYEQFCAFGRELDEWLHRHGAQTLFDRVEVDNADPAALRHWQHHVGVLSGHTDQPDWTTPRYERWTLASRRLLNPGSVGGEAWHIELQAPDDTASAWQAGDIAEIGPRQLPARVLALLEGLQLPASAPVNTRHGNEPLAQALSRLQLPTVEAVRGLPPQALVDALPPLPHREYSIASIPQEGCVRLLVRQMTQADGSPGLGSGWLCEGVDTGQAIDLRLRPNPGFHPPPTDRPLVLVGNGTGIAGLRAHLQARIAAGARDNWLLFGERSPQHDRPYGQELQRWQADGWLARIDLAYSRDPDAAAYVQHSLRAAGETLRAWVERGATILVCGNASGMAPGVDAVLAEVLGQALHEALRAQGRYRRDVY